MNNIPHVVMNEWHSAACMHLLTPSILYAIHDLTANLTLHDKQF